MNNKLGKNIALNYSYIYSYAKIWWLRNCLYTTSPEEFSNFLFNKFIFAFIANYLPTALSLDKHSNMDLLLWIVLGWYRYRVGVGLVSVSAETPDSYILFKIFSTIRRRLLMLSAQINFFLIDQIIRRNKVINRIGDISDLKKYICNV